MLAGTRGVLPYPVFSHVPVEAETAAGNEHNRCKICVKYEEYSIDCYNITHGKSI